MNIQNSSWLIHSNRVKWNWHQNLVRNVILTWILENWLVVLNMSTVPMTVNVKQCLLQLQLLIAVTDSWIKVKSATLCSVKLREMGVVLKIHKFSGITGLTCNDNCKWKGCGNVHTFKLWRTLPWMYKTHHDSFFHSNRVKWNQCHGLECVFNLDSREPIGCSQYEYCTNDCQCEAVPTVAPTVNCGDG